jgi:hypothetical protein
MQLMHFYNALNRAKAPTVDGESFTYKWEDDEEDELALRIVSENSNFVIYSTDTIAKIDKGIIVSIGATDYEFVL